MMNNRPLSPHLSIHKKVLTSIFSIFHRLTGIGLSIGSVLITAWIAIISLGADYFFLLEYISSFLIFKIILFIWTVGIFFHLFNGIRYLVWSFGVGMDLKTVYISSYFVLCMTLIASLIVWLAI